MKCPKCGYHRQTRDNAFVPATECPACGVVYAKHENEAASASAGSLAPALPNLKPSPVDAASLKKARERVEKRLRERLGEKVRDKRHAQTLKLARRFAEEEVRKRRSQWEEKQRQKVAGADAPASTEKAQPPAPETTAPAEKKAYQATEPAGDRASAPVDGKTTAAGKAPASDPGQITAQKRTAAVADGSRAPDTGRKPETDVSVETVILVSPPTASPDDEPDPESDSTPLGSMSSAEDGVQEDDTDAAARKPDSPTTMDPGLAAVIKSTANRGNGLVRMLATVAWLMLTAGFIGAVLSWTTISDVQAGTRIAVPESLDSLPIGLLLGFAYLATGALGFAFFWVSSVISRQLKDIRRLLMQRPGAMIAPMGPAGPFCGHSEDKASPEAETPATGTG